MSVPQGELVSDVLWWGGGLATTPSHPNFCCVTVCTAMLLVGTAHGCAVMAMNGPIYAVADGMPGSCCNAAGCFVPICVATPVFNSFARRVRDSPPDMMGFMVLWPEVVAGLRRRERALMAAVGTAGVGGCWVLGSHQQYSTARRFQDQQAEYASNDGGRV